MDGSAQLTEVRFSRKRQGYDPDEVDNFLERVGEKVYELQEKVRTATQRAESAEQAVAAAEARAEAAEAEAARAGSAPAAADAGGEGGPTRDTDDLEETLKRTLVLAQRTADTAISEARTEAERIVSEAQATADRLASDTDTTCKRKLEDAERQAQQRIEAASGPIKTEVLRLEERQQKLVEATSALEVHLDAQRARIREALGALQAVVDDPSKFATSAPPRPVDGAVDEAVAAPSAPARSTAPDDEASDESDAGTSTAEPTEAPAEARPTVPPLVARPTAGTAAGRPSTPSRPAPARPSARPGDDSGPPTARIDLTSEPPVVEDDNLLDELRKAVGEGDAESSDDADGDEALQAFFDQRDADLEGERRSRFGRRH